MYLYECDTHKLPQQNAYRQRHIFCLNGVFILPPRHWCVCCACCELACIAITAIIRNREAGRPRKERYKKKWQRFLIIADKTRECERGNAHCYSFNTYIYWNSEDRRPFNIILNDTEHNEICSNILCLFLLYNKIYSTCRTNQNADRHLGSGYFIFFIVSRKATLYDVDR